MTSRFIGWAFCGAIGAASLAAQSTEGVTPVAVGVLRLDADLIARSEDWTLPAGAGGRASSLGYGYLQFSAGVTDRLEARVAAQGWQRDEVDGDDVEGMGDLLLAAKWRVAGDESAGPAVAVMPYLKIPTAGARFADDTVDGGVLAIYGQPLGEHGFLNAQAGLDDYGDGAGGRDWGWSASLVAGRGCGERWTVYAEALADGYPASGGDDTRTLSLGGGVTWAGDADGTWGLDLAAYGGVNRAATDLQAVLRLWVDFDLRRAP